MKSQIWITTLIGILFLSIVIFLPSLLLSSPVGTALQRADSTPLVVVAEPTSEELDPYVTWVPTNEPNNEDGPPIPTETTAPTLTPLPTFTPRPEPTATPFPTKGLAENPSGQILYTTPRQAGIFSISVNAEGQIGGDMEKLPDLPINDLILFDASPDGQYLLLMEISVGHAKPYVYNRQTGDTKHVFDEEDSTIGQYFGWHPDSRHIFFGRLGTGLGMVNVETGLVTMLAVASSPIQGAAVSPDGQSIIYIAESHLSLNTGWLAETSGNGSQILIGDDGPSYIFDWSPLGNQVLTLGGGGRNLVSDVPQSPLWILDVADNRQQPLNAPFINRVVPESLVSGKR